MLEELAARVLEQAGSPGGGAAALAADLEAAIVKGAGAPGNDAGDVGEVASVSVTFRSRDGRLHIVVSSPAGEIWHHSREIP
jgi:hypothetical protein